MDRKISLKTPGNRKMMGKIIWAERPKKDFCWKAQRMRDITALIEFRHGGEIPETDDRQYQFVIAQLVKSSLPTLEAQIERIEECYFAHCKWIKNPEEEIRGILESIRHFDHMMSAPKTGRMVGLKLAERDALGIKSMSPCDISPKAFKALCRQRKRENDRISASRKRAKAGAKTRSEYEENSLSRSKPWVAEGISRSTWYERKKQAKSVSGQVRSHSFENQSDAIGQVRSTGSRTSPSPLSNYRFDIESVTDSPSGDAPVQAGAESEASGALERPPAAYHPSPVSEDDQNAA